MINIEKMMRFIFLLCFFLLTACSSKGGLSDFKPLAPEISLKNFQLLEMGLSKQRYRLRLEVKNPNSFSLPINQLDYKLFINDQFFAEGVSTKPISIPALGTSIVETDVSSNLMDVIEGWSQWFSLAKRSLNYKITGNIGVSSLSIPMSFQYADKVDLLLTN